MFSWKSVLITIVAIFALKIWNPYFVENISWSWFDYLHQQQGEFYVDDIVLVDIDEKTLETYGQYPLPRNIYAEIMLETHWSNTHVFTQLFKEVDRFGGDEIFAEGLVNRLSILSSLISFAKLGLKWFSIPVTQSSQIIITSDNVFTDAHGLFSSQPSHILLSSTNINHAFLTFSFGESNLFLSIKYIVYSFLSNLRNQR